MGVLSAVLMYRARGASVEIVDSIPGACKPPCSGRVWHRRPTILGRGGRGDFEHFLDGITRNDEKGHVPLVVSEFNTEVEPEVYDAVTCCRHNRGDGGAVKEMVFRGVQVWRDVSGVGMCSVYICLCMKLKTRDFVFVCCMSMLLMSVRNRKGQHLIFCFFPHFHLPLNCGLLFRSVLPRRKGLAPPPRLDPR